MQILQWRRLSSVDGTRFQLITANLVPKVCWVFNMAAGALHQFPKLRSWLRTNHNPPPPPPLRKKVYLRCVSISVLNDLWSGNPQNHWQGVIPFLSVYKDILIFRQLKELFFAVLWGFELYFTSDFYEIWTHAKKNGQTSSWRISEVV